MYCFPTFRSLWTTKAKIGIIVDHVQFPHHAQKIHNLRFIGELLDILFLDIYSLLILFSSMAASSPFLIASGGLWRSVYCSSIHPCLCPERAENGPPDTSVPAARSPFSTLFAGLWGSSQQDTEKLFFPQRSHGPLFRISWTTCGPQTIGWEPVL